MTVFYYIIEGKPRIVCTSDAYPQRGSPVWLGCSTSVWIVPGTSDHDDNGQSGSVTPFAPIPAPRGGPKRKKAPPRDDRDGAYVVSDRW